MMTERSVWIIIFFIPHGVVHECGLPEPRFDTQLDRCRVTEKGRKVSESKRGLLPLRVILWLKVKFLDACQLVVIVQAVLDATGATRLTDASESALAWADVSLRQTEHAS